MGSTGNPSIGVNTGRITSSQFSQLLTGATRSGESYGTLGNIPDRLFVDNEDGTGGYTIDFTGLRGSSSDKADIKDAFLRSLRGRSNTDNSQRAYDRAYREAINAGRTEAEARRLAQNARRSVSRNVVNGVISKNNRFSGIRTTSRRVRRT